MQPVTQKPILNAFINIIKWSLFQKQGMFCALQLPWVCKAGMHTACVVIKNDLKAAVNGVKPSQLQKSIFFLYRESQHIAHDRIFTPGCDTSPKVWPNLYSHFPSRCLSLFAQFFRSLDVYTLVLYTSLLIITFLVTLSCFCQRVSSLLTVPFVFIFGRRFWGSLFIQLHQCKT